MCCIDVKLAFRGHQADKNEMNGTNDRILIFFLRQKIIEIFGFELLRVTAHLVKRQQINTAYAYRFNFLRLLQKIHSISF